MNTKHIFQCEDSLEGVLSGVYTAWAARVGHGNVEIRTWENENLELFCQYHVVESDLSKAEKVMQTMRKRLGTEITEYICYAACSQEREKGTAIYRTLVDCLSVYGAEYRRKHLDNLKNPYVRLVVQAYQNVWYEYHHYLGFLRFSQIPGNVLFSSIAPQNDLLLLFQEHFGDRFVEEYWIIYDEKRKKALLHAPHEACNIFTGESEKMEKFSNMKDAEADYESLFQGFCEHISIHERENRKLQRQNLPLRFRKHMLEFHKI
ncbi:MAG: DNA metabolism protein [Clostridia bacterium]|nr:DNA metabolism protein [Clostridia bacterium]NCC44066.1 DNA metabolism protein [Clostridia bacterium]